MSDISVHLDPAKLDELLNSPDGPVGETIAELSKKATEIAKTAAPVMKRPKWNPEYQYGPPGKTRESVHWSGFRFNKLGQLYSGVNARYGPTLFLERPAIQVTPKIYAFLSTALDGAEL